MNPLPTYSRSLQTVPRPHVRLHIYFIAYERAVPTLMALFSAPRRRMFRVSSWDLVWLSVRFRVTMRLGSTYIRLISHILIPMYLCIAPPVIHEPLASLMN